LARLERGDEACWPDAHPAALAEMFDKPLDTLEWMDKVDCGQPASGFDATDWLYQSWAYQAHDVGTTPGFGGDTNAALESVKARAMVLAPPLDLLNPTQCAQEAADAIPTLPAVLRAIARAGNPDLFVEKLDVLGLT